MAFIDELCKDGYNDNAARLAAEIIIDAAIGKAIVDKREIIKPSIEHFLNGGNVNGEFRIALQKLFMWAEKKAIDAVNERLNKKDTADTNRQDKITNMDNDLIKELSKFLWSLTSPNIPLSDKAKKEAGVLNDRIKAVGENLIDRNRAITIASEFFAAGVRKVKANKKSHAIGLPELLDLYFPETSR